MAHSSNSVAVYLEVGKKRTLAGACDWPGWCRGGRDEAAALQALIEYGGRYERVLNVAGLSFHAPADATLFDVVERLVGNTTTDFGAPDVAPSSDVAPVDEAELQRLQEVLKACWSAFDIATQAAIGKELREGPRGGGRDLLGVARHVLGAEASYLARLGGKLSNLRDADNVDNAGDKNDKDDPGLIFKHRRVKDQRQSILETLGAAARGEIALRWPRGGTRWTPRFFVRRAAWHILAMPGRSRITSNEESSPKRELRGSAIRHAPWPQPNISVTNRRVKVVV